MSQINPNLRDFLATSAQQAQQNTSPLWNRLRSGQAANAAPMQQWRQWEVGQAPTNSVQAQNWRTWLPNGALQQQGGANTWKQWEVGQNPSPPGSGFLSSNGYKGGAR